MEVIGVDDGSEDETYAHWCRRCQHDDRFNVIKLSRNFGHQAAVSAGLAHATGDAAIILDADLQDPPEVVGELIAIWQTGFEVVHAVRTSRQDKLIKRWLASNYYRLLARMTDFDVPTDAGDFCLLDHKVIDVINQLPERTRYLRGLRCWVGFRQASVAYHRDARVAGRPKYTMVKSMRLAFDGIVSLSTVPLRLVIHLGPFISMMSLLGIGFAILQFVFRPYLIRWGIAPLPGFATVVISIHLIGGVQLICLGMIGEYIARIYDETKGRPI
ncbi:MAG: glycosyltransferase family 2 protein [Planctomycetota bacterium]